MDNETIKTLIPPTISLIVTSIFGLLVGILVEKFKNRFRTVEYSIRSQKIIPPLSAGLGGQLTLKLNERDVKTLKVTTIEIENNNSIDLEDIVVRFTLGKGSIFQGNEAYLLSNYNWLSWTQEFNDNFNQILKEYNLIETNPTTGFKELPDLLQKRVDYVLSNRDYFIPVLNRKNKAIFNFLIEDPIDGSESGIFPSITQKSINFVLKSDDQRQKQIDLWVPICIGILITSLIVRFIVGGYPEHKNLIIWTSIVGFSYSITGFIIYFAFKKIISFFK